MRVLLQIFGVAALLVGSLWIGQGLGLLNWPSSSFMVGQRFWAGLGAILVLLSALLLWRAGQRRR